MKQRKSVKKIVSRTGKWAVVFLLLSVLFMQHSVYAAIETVADDFSSGGWAGGTASDPTNFNWVGNWQVAGADIFNGAARFSEVPEAIYRVVDLSNANSASVSFDVANEGVLEDQDVFTVDFCEDDTFANCQVLFTDQNAFVPNPTNVSNVAITIPLGAGNVIRARVEAEYWGPDEYSFIDNVVISADVNNVVPTEISGLVFRDYSADGVNNAEEPGVAGISITAYDASGVAVDADTTDANGNYTLTGLTDGVDYRLEMTGLPDYLQPGPVGTDADTSVVFATSPASGVQFGVFNPSDYCQNDPSMTTPCYSNGNPTGTGTTAGSSFLYSFPYSAADTTPAPTTLAQGDDIGATYGLAFQRSTNQLFAAALMKRHVGYGPAGSGGIYVIDDPAGTPTSSLFVDLATLGLGYSFGSTNHTNLPNDAANPNHDGSAGSVANNNDVFSAVGKESFGDMDISDDEKTLYLVDLTNRALLSIFVDLPAQVPDASDVTSYSIPDPGCTNGGYRPWALKAQDGLVYVGIVCDEFGATAANPDAFVYAFDPAALPVPTFTQVFSMNLQYTRGYSSSGAPTPSANWRPWIDQWNDIFVLGNLPYGKQVSNPQAILADIEFDNDGSMILGFMDRFGHQSGAANYSTNPADTTRYEGVAAGDLIRVCLVAGTFTLENNGSCGGDLTLGAGNTQGPGGGEFYWQDMHEVDINPAAGTHQETTIGSLAMLRGEDDVAVTVWDPIDNVMAGGIGWYDNSDGTHPRGYEMYRSVTDPDNSDSTFFGKSNGLGDLEVLCDPAPLEIGNRIWQDNDKDGIQDPGEPGVGNVVIQLWADTDGNGSIDVQVAQTTADANGNYLFSQSGTNTYGAVENWGYTAANEVAILTKYEIRIDLDQTDVGKRPLTTANAPQPANGNASATDNDSITDVADSDATLVSGDAVIALTTGGAGNNNHGLDTGLLPVVALGSTVWDDIDGDGVQDSSENGLENATVYLRDSSGNPAVDAQGNAISSVMTGSNGYYYFENLSPGAYYVEVVPPPSGYVVSGNQNGNPVNNVNTGSENVSNTDSNFDTSATAAVANAIRSGLITLTQNSEPTSEAQTCCGGSGAAGSDDPGGINSDIDDDANMTVDFALTQPVAIGSTVWYETDGDGVQENGEVGLAGATVHLRNSDGSAATDVDGNTVTSYLTVGNGYYYFGNLMPGDYYVEVVPPTGYVPTGNQNANAVDNTDSGNENVSNTDTNINLGTTAAVANAYRSGLVTLTATSEPLNEAQVCCGGTGAAGSDNPGSVNSANDDDANMTVDLGFTEPVALGSTVWADTNGNGIQDTGENGLAGATVYLVDSSGNQITMDATGNTINPVTTGANGYYSFSNLPPGDYYIEVDFPAGYTTGTNQNGNPVDNTDSGNENVSNTDSNIATSATSTVGDYRSGLITLTPNSEPTGETRSCCGGGADNPSNVNSANDDNANMTVDFGVVPVVSLGSLVWNDANNNGVQDNGESGISGATVYLLDGSGNSVNDANGNAVGSVTTGANGLYAFKNLLPGTYYVEVVPGGVYAPSATQNGSAVNGTDSNNTDSNIDTTATPTNAGASRSGLITLAVGAEQTGETQAITGGGADNPNGANDADSSGNMTVDMGFRPLVTGRVIGSTIWHDLNNDGIFDVGELGIPGITVQLLDNGGTPTGDTAVTDANGMWYIDGLAEDTNYSLRFIPAAGYTFNAATQQTLGGGQIGANTSPANTNNDSNIVSAAGGYLFSPVIRFVNGSSAVIGELLPDGTTADDPSGVNGGSTGGTLDQAANMTADFGLISLPIDLGDLLDSYNTITAYNGPSHSVSSALRMGACVDAETNGQPNNQAGVTGVGGDDGSVGASVQGTCATAGDDEDGLTLPFLTAGAAIPLNVQVEYPAVASAPDAVLAGWYDSTGDGDFADAGDAITPVTNVANGTSGTATVTIPAITPAVLNEQLGCRTALRLRLSSDTTDAPGLWYAGGQPNYTGFATNGEVEDYVMVCNGFEADYGDHYETTNYETILLSNGPRHYYAAPPTKYLGACVDTETNGQDTAAANGDDQSGVGTTTYGSCTTVGDDEDGVSMTNSTTWGDGNASLDVAVTDTAGGEAGCVIGWADWNSDGDFDDTINDGVGSVSELLFTVDVTTSGTTQQAISTPRDSLHGGSYAYPSSLNTRYRLFVGSCGSLSGPQTLSVGNVVGGEVEDFQWDFQAPTAVSLSSFNANSNVTGSVGIIILLSLMLVTGSFIIIWRRKVTN